MNMQREDLIQHLEELRRRLIYTVADRDRLVNFTSLEVITQESPTSTATA